MLKLVKLRNGNSKNGSVNIYQVEQVLELSYH